MFNIDNDAPWMRKKPATSKVSSTPYKMVNVSRRNFLKTSALAAGSTFVLGLFSGCQPTTKESYADTKVPASGTMNEAGFQPNVFLGINDAGDVFIICSRS